MKIPIFPGKYHQNGGFSWAMLVYRRVVDFPGCNFEAFFLHLLSKEIRFGWNFVAVPLIARPLNDAAGVRVSGISVKIFQG